MLGAARRALSRRPWVIIGLAAITAFVLGVIGFLEAGRDASDAFYGAIRLFGMQVEPRDPPLTLEIARFLAPLTLAAAGIGALLKLFSAEIEVFRARRQREHVVVCGLGRRGQQLVDALRARGEQVIGIDPDESGGGLDVARRRGAVALLGDATDPEMLRRARVDRARWLVCTCTDDKTNLTVAGRAEDVAGEDSELRVFVAIDDPELGWALRERALEDDAERSTAVGFFSVAQEAARAMIRRYPFLDLGDGAASPPQVLIVGTGPAAQGVLLHAARLWEGLRTADDERLPVVVVDRQATGAVRELLAKNPPLGRLCSIDAVDAWPGHTELEDLRDRVSGGNGLQAYVCLDTESTAIAAGLALERWVDGDVVVLVPSAAESVGRFLALEPGRAVAGHRVVLFGAIEEACSPELLERHRVESWARALHESYVRQQLAAGATVAEKPNLRDWEELSEAVKRDNRDHARSIGRHLERAGLEARLLDRWGIPAATLSPEELESLARSEHERWREARIADGWTYGERRDDGRRIHPDLLPWDELPDSSRETNRAFARELPALLLAAGFALERKR